jgi:carboxylate-amine ligase
LATLRRLQPHALALNAQAAMDEIERTAGRDFNHAGYLRRRYAETGSVQGVVRASVDALRRGPG